MVGSLVDVIHAFAAWDLDNVNLATKLYVTLLLSDVSYYCSYLFSGNTEKLTSFWEKMLDGLLDFAKKYTWKTLKLKTFSEIYKTP